MTCLPILYGRTSKSKPNNQLGPTGYWTYLENESETSKDGTKFDDIEKLTKDSKYDKHEHSCRFLWQWTDNSPWVEYLETDDKMFCRNCCDSPSTANSENQIVQGHSHSTVFIST